MSNSITIWTSADNFKWEWILPRDSNIWDLEIIWWVYWNKEWVLAWCNISGWEVTFVVKRIWGAVKILCLFAWENWACHGFKRGSNNSLVEIIHCPNTIQTIAPQYSEKEVA